MVASIAICQAAALIGSMFTLPAVGRLVRGTEQAFVDAFRRSYRCGVDGALSFDGSFALSGVGQKFPNFGKSFGSGRARVEPPFAKLLTGRGQKQNNHCGLFGAVDFERFMVVCFL